MVGKGKQIIKKKLDFLGILVKRENSEDGVVHILAQETAVMMGLPSNMLEVRLNCKAECR